MSERFSEADLKVALRAVQNREIGYREFVMKIMTAGVVSYTVFLAGSRAVYVGRHGDLHLERFAGTK